MKICSRCGTGTAVSSSWCRKCEREYNKERYAAKKRVLEKIKELFSCDDCLRYYPHFIMEWDHKDGYPTRHIGPSWSWKAILQEMDKCDLVCANCHRTRTYERRSVRVLV